MDLIIGLIVAFLIVSVGVTYGSKVFPRDDSDGAGWKLIILLIVLIPVIGIILSR